MAKRMKMDEEKKQAELLYVLTILIFMEFFYSWVFKCILWHGVLGIVKMIHMYLTKFLKGNERTNLLSENLKHAAC